MSTTVPRPDQSDESREAEALDAYSRVVVDVAERLAPSVANLRVMRRTRGGQVPAGAGSAVALTPDGFLLTSAHVVLSRGHSSQPSAGRAAFVDGRELALHRRRRRPAVGPRGAPRRRRRPRPGHARRRRVAARGPARGRDRQPQRVRGLGDRRRRVGPRPLAPRARGTQRAVHRQRDPDRRGAEPGQLGRGAGRQPRSRDRDQHRRGRGRPRPGRSDQRRHPPDHRLADARRARAPRLHRDRRRPAAAAATRPDAPGAQGRGRGGRGCRRTARPPARACAPRT